MADITERRNEQADDEIAAVKRRLPRSAITALSVACVLLIWEAAGPFINPVFGSYPSAIAAASAANVICRVTRPWLRL